MENTESAQTKVKTLIVSSETQENKSLEEKVELHDLEMDKKEVLSPGNGKEAKQKMLPCFHPEIDNIPKTANVDHNYTNEQNKEAVPMGSHEMDKSLTEATTSEGNGPPREVRSSRKNVDYKEGLERTQKRGRKRKAIPYKITTVTEPLELEKSEGFSDEKSEEKSEENQEESEYVEMTDGQTSAHNCLICGKIFEKLRSTICHLFNHIPEKFFGCKKCHETFKKPAERNEHTKTHQDYENLLACRVCGMAFESLLMLNKHAAKEHMKKGTFLCINCSRHVVGTNELIAHILTHQPFKCFELNCRELLKPGTQYEEHIKTMHKGCYDIATDIGLD